MINACILSITYLKVVYNDRIEDVVGTKVLHHRAQNAAGHSDVDGELSGDRVEPEVQLGSDRNHRLDWIT